ncbi:MULTISPECIES: hypothetical protein [unclassified Bradyrhizobium]|uniref:hypothetical protein n=1 Tax=Bradyrhizobium sp. USDA 4541 TaxID=2817704 RepID=UPI0020A2AABE|nr:hypothetical protein [Bradyrhizobium sp. USDA 4541]MCP1851225.1 hypothetical protein [Bradyrhizobium sp. USDA 4541]
MPVITLDDEGGREKVDVPIEAHPNLITVIKWRPPEIYFHRHPDDNGIKDAFMDGMSDGRMWTKARNVARAARKKRIGLNQGGVHVDEFARFLAKIGHSFAVAERGLGEFTPFLLNAILGKRPMFLSYLIGNSIVSDTSPTPDVHEIKLREESIRGRTFLVARIQLFADIGVVDKHRNTITGMQAYDVIAGEVA